MIKYNIRFAWRRILRQKLVTLINIFGLALGLTVGIFVILYFKHELSYDRWIPQHNQVFRVVQLFGSEGVRGTPSTPSQLSSLLREKVPGIKESSRFIQSEDILVSVNKEHYTLPRVSSVDSTFFQTIPLPFLLGNAVSAFASPQSVVLSYPTAVQIFGLENPIGETLLLENSQPLKVTGVLAPFEGPSHLEDALFINTSLGETSWTGSQGSTYVHLDSAAVPSDIEARIGALVRENIIKEYQKKGKSALPQQFPSWQLQTLSDVHLASVHLGADTASAGSYRQLLILASLALLVLLLAIINFVNLATAQTSIRSAEIATRKATGANRAQILKQFLSEGILLSFLSLILALIMAQPLLNFFNEIINRSLQFTSLQNVYVLLSVFFMTLILGTISGLIPGYFLSRLQIAPGLKGKIQSLDHTKRIRKGLVIFQFSLSIILISVVTLVWQQINYMTGKDLGFNGDQIAAFSINDFRTVESFPKVKQRLLNIPGIIAATQTSRSPGTRVSNYGYICEDLDKKISVNTIFSDLDWNHTFNIPILQGRFFSSEYGRDTIEAFVVNEAFVKSYRIDQPLGFRLKFSSDETYGKIIGVVSDFHYEGLQQSIDPLIISARPDKGWRGQVAIRVNENDLQESLSQVQSFWKEMEPAFPVRYAFIDDDFSKQYDGYRRSGKTLLYTSGFCILVALLGLFGLSVFMAQQRTKEIGIRKVLGASVSAIVALVSGDFVKLIFVSFLLASPVSLFLIQQWLKDFAYRVELEWWILPFIGFLVTILAFLTTGVHSLMAALKNPADSLKSE